VTCTLSFPMAFLNPDPTFGHTADRVQSLHERIADVRDEFGEGETDARRVNLNNVLMATGSASATLRLFHWAKFGGGDATLILALGLAQPAFINLVAEDMLRSSKHFLLLEGQFQFETLLRNVSIALTGGRGAQGFYNLARDVIGRAGLPEPADKLADMNVAALMRNSMHSNGLHHGYQGSSTERLIAGVEFRFVDGERVQCGHWVHVTTALTASLGVVREILASEVVTALHAIPDRYAELRARDD
jgi:hypothetical protein